VENCGVYEIINRVNGHRYIGSSCDIPRRWKDHQQKLNKGTHCNIHLQRAWIKYGKESFEFHVLIECQPDELIEIEQRHIDDKSPEYNLAIFASGGSYPGVHAGIKRPDRALWNKNHKTRGHTGCLHSEETKVKMSTAWVERKKHGLSEETRARMSVAASLRRHTPETKAKISALLMGHKVTPEQFQKLEDGFIDWTINRKVEACLLYFQS
jgi:group I intron endonuclease